jgi:hypothetical protein
MRSMLRRGRARRLGAMVNTGKDMRTATVVGFGFVLAALACGGPAQAQGQSKAYACSFTMGTAYSYENGAFKTKTPEPLSFEITDIDLDNQSASLVTDGREQPGTLKIVRAINANHFLEVVNEGFLNLTTIYDKDPATGTHPAVHSRHFGVLGEPFFAQYAGTCTEK